MATSARRQLRLDTTRLMHRLTSQYTPRHLLRCAHHDKGEIPRLAVLARLWQLKAAVDPDILESSCFQARYKLITLDTVLNDIVVFRYWMKENALVRKFEVG